MTHETTPDIWLNKRIHRIQSMLKNELITLATHDIEIAQAHNIHAELVRMNEEGRAILNVKHLGSTLVIVTGFATDQDANPYIRFKLRTKGAEFTQIYKP